MYYKVMIFDVGGVLIDVDTERKENKFLQKLAYPEKILDFITSPSIREFDIDRITSVEFFYIIKNYLGYAGNYIEFINDYCSILFPKYEIFGLVRSLRMKNPALDFWILSNVNRLHWHHINKTWPNVISQFSKLFLSYKMGMAKPFKEIYTTMYNEGNVKPEETIFIDNLIVNGAYPMKMGTKFIYFENRYKLAEELTLLGVKT